MPKYEVRLFVQATHYHYINAATPDEAVEKASELFHGGEPTEQPGCEDYRILDTDVEEQDEED